MKDVRCLFFDVGGTIFDWKTTARRNIEAVATKYGQKVDSDAFAQDWRSAMFKIHNQVRIGDRPWLTADQMHFHALEEMATKYSLLDKVDKMEFTKNTWHNLDVFDGASDAITRLRSRFTVMVLTILNYESIVTSAKRGGVIWDGIFSCELFGYYKPSLEAYKKAMSTMSLRPEEACMVAAHKGDLAAASTVGMRTVYVQAPVEDHVGVTFAEPTASTFDSEAKNYDELCRFFDV